MKGDLFDPQATAYTLSFEPAANVLAAGGASASGASSADVASASLGVVIQPCIVGEWCMHASAPYEGSAPLMLVLCHVV